MCTYVLADKYKKLAAAVALGEVCERVGVRSGREIFYCVILNSLCIFTMLYLKKTLQIIVMNALNSQSDLKGTCKFPMGVFLKAQMRTLIIMLGNAHFNLWRWKK